MGEAPQLDVPFLRVFRRSSFSIDLLGFEPVPNVTPLKLAVVVLAKNVSSLGKRRKPGASKALNPKPYPRAPMQFLLGFFYAVLVKDYNIVPKKELHRRVGVKP